MNIAAIAAPPPIPSPARLFARSARDERDAVTERREPDRRRQRSQVTLPRRPRHPHAPEYVSEAGRRLRARIAQNG